ncbi:hypothetical protein BELL_1231g00040 [Botrytis elliptica]|uniref:Helicase C-terminal domain-containing protein n=1 Tax=Botrytis elliptica TaxID=278938 RepID=A0A4Z1IGQ2_9HELO|nr:hypothetical protein EAE99_009556 [Botrytis elliptica]TGO59704.1 hypothetical protein BELL_1231g00040 [Botrytis elliptica]
MRKGIPIAGSDEVQQWSNMDDDHGVSVRFKKCRPRGAHYLPPPTNRIHTANVHMAESVRMQAMLAQLSTRMQGEHCALVYFNWTVSQVAAEGVLVLLGFKVLTLCSHHNPKERRRIIALFRDSAYECDALLVEFRIGSHGQNFYEACSKLLIINETFSSMIDINHC